MKVFMPSPNEQWVVDNIIAEFSAHTRHELVSDPAHADVVYMYSKWITPRYKLHDLVAKPCITTVHHIVPSKGIDIAYFDRFTDVYHVPNDITLTMLRQLTKKPIVKLKYWINDDVFKPSKTKSIDGKIVLGSSQRDTEGADLISPKLEKGPDILANIAIKLGRDRCTMLLGGWRRQYIIDRLKNAGIEFTYHERIKDIATLYTACDYYLITSRWEGGPQAALEASQMRTRLLSTPVGIVPELLHSDCLCSTVDEFVDKIMNTKIDHTVEANYESVQGLRMRSVVADYDDFIDSVARGVL